jgi:hypothetical protein
MLEELLNKLPRFVQLTDDERRAWRMAARQLQQADDFDPERVLEVLAAAPQDVDMLSKTDPAALAALLESLWHLPENQPISAQSARQAALQPSPLRLSDTAVEQAGDLYRQLGTSNRCRYHLLCLLASEGRPAALAQFAELIVSDAPTDSRDAALAFVPLLQRKNRAATMLFPRLLDALASPSVAAVVIDLANFLFRRGWSQPHPAAERAATMQTLLQGLIVRMEKLAVHPEDFAETPAALATLVNETLTLIVPLCDALALMEARAALPVLRQAAELPHRRIRTEAAAAMARLGDAAGSELLLEMLDQPVERTRATAYLTELNQAARIAPEYQGVVAVAEGNLAAWLAEPAQFGMPPHVLTLLDQSQKFWPGFTEPVDCLLFRFEYRLGDRGFSGIALAGPTLHAFHADLADLPPADIHAIFAGWQAEHPDISEVLAENLPAVIGEDWPHMTLVLGQQGFENPQLIKVARFFEEEHWVITAQRDGLSGVLILDQGEPHWYPLPASTRPLGPSEVYYLHKGRKLLRAFNE